MKIVHFTQDEAEWLAWRKQGIGATDISVIMGSNPYQTPLKLWETKCGFREEPQVNQAMAHGKTYEPIARQWMNEHHQLFLKPLCVEDSENNVFRASLDGYDFDTETLVEIKCPVSESTLEKARIEKSVPSHWYDQVQWQIMITQPKRAMIAIWDYRYQQCYTIDVFGVSKKIMAMREKAKDFWHHVQIGKEPPAQGKDFKEIDDPILTQYLFEYQTFAEKKKIADNRLKEIKEEICKFAKDGNITSQGFKVQLVSRSPGYDIEKMRMDGIDVDKYLKDAPHSQSYRITGPR